MRWICWFFAVAWLLWGRSATADESWNGGDLRRDVAAGKPLVVHVTVALCSNDQVDCGSGVAGRPGDLAHNLYWGAIFGARRFLERKRSPFTRVSLEKVDDVVLERAVYRRWVPGKAWGVALRVEQLVVLDAVHGASIDRAVSGFWSKATQKATVSFEDGGKRRSVAVQVAGYVGHNRLMDGLALPGAPATPDPVPSFVLACYSKNYFSSALEHSGSRPLVMTRALMAPEGYVLEAVLTGIGDGLPQQQIRARAVAAYARWQRLRPGVASAIFAPVAK